MVILSEGFVSPLFCKNKKCISYFFNMFWWFFALVWAPHPWSWSVSLQQLQYLNQWFLFSYHWLQSNNIQKNVSMTLFRHELALLCVDVVQSQIVFNRMHPPKHNILEQFLKLPFDNSHLFMSLRVNTF